MIKFLNIIILTVAFASANLPEKFKADPVKPMADNQTYGDNPYLYPCTLDTQCNNMFKSCYTENNNSTDKEDDQSYAFCACEGAGGDCTTNEDCCDNICEFNNKTSLMECAWSGGTQGSPCNKFSIGCSDGYSCHPWGIYGYCNYIAPDNNPFLYPCDSDDKCINEVHHCVKVGGDNSSYWFCGCFGGDENCTRDQDCCTNICDSGKCTSTGGTQGCFCNPRNARCAPGYDCLQWGINGVFYCNRSSNFTSTIAPTNPTTTISSDNNPYLHPCTSDRDCNNTVHECAMNGGPNSSYWFCTCYCGSGPCKMDDDCSTNICKDGVCSSTGGTQGAVCSSACSDMDQCAPGYVCQSWGNFGYCNYNPTNVSSF